MRTDIAKLICERQRQGSREPSIKTALKLKPNLDYDDSFDSGPNYVSSARHRQEGRCNPVAVNMGKKKGPGESKNLNENLRPLYQFLQKSVGRPWNDVYSEICKNINPTKAIDFHVLQHVGWHVELHVEMEDGKPYSNKYRRGEVSGLYVHPDTGILCDNGPRRQRYVRPVPPIESLHWYGNFWYKLEVIKKEAICGCVHFKVPPPPDRTDRYYYRHRDEPAVCIHGNQPVPRPIWYVVEYGYHQPDEVYKTYRYKDYVKSDGTVSPFASRYGLSEDTPVVHIYYRDVPEKMKEGFVVSKKTAGRKQLKAIKKAIEAAKAAS